MLPKLENVMKVLTPMRAARAALSSLLPFFLAVLPIVKLKNCSTMLKSPLKSGPDGSGTTIIRNSNVSNYPVQRGRNITYKCDIDKHICNANQHYSDQSRPSELFLQLADFTENLTELLVCNNS